MNKKKIELNAKKDDLTMPEKTFNDAFSELMFEWESLNAYKLTLDQDCRTFEVYRKSEIDRIFKKFTEQVSNSHTYTQHHVKR